MKSKTQIRKIAKKLNAQIAISMGAGRLKKINLRRAAARIESLQRQVERRSFELLQLKESVKPYVKFGHTRLDGLDIQKVHVRGHHVKAYYCKAYDSLHVKRI